MITFRQKKKAQRSRLRFAQSSCSTSCPSATCCCKPQTQAESWRVEHFVSDDSEFQSKRPYVVVRGRLDVASPAFLCGKDGRARRFGSEQSAEKACAEATSMLQ
jgi:hypothetical protein